MGSIHAFVEGGQTWAHRIRMVRQVMKVAAYFSFTFALAIFIASMSRLDSAYYQASYYHLKARAFEVISKSKMNISSGTWEKISRERYFSSSTEVPVHRVIERTNPYYIWLIEKVKEEAIFSSLVGACSYLLTLLFFSLRGRLNQRKKHVSGRKRVSKWRLIAYMKFRRLSSPIKLGGVPMVKNTETQHMLISGGTGSGKTNCLHHILRQIRKNDQRVIVVDTTGDFVERYYREGKDVILNPFDGRSAEWSPWAECQEAYDYECLAESFIPSTYNDSESYWRTAARSVFSAVLSSSSGIKRLSSVTQILLKDALSDLCSYVKHTKAAAHLDIGSEKTAASIRSVASSFIEPLDLLKDTQDPFSIREWISNEESDSWLFISCSTEQRSAVKPLLSAWISTAIRSTLHLDKSFQRRLWFFIDELPSLQKIRDLELLVTEGRKFGACAVLAIQSPSQLNAIYGKEAAQVILGNCLTKVVFYEQDPEVAQRISKLFGETEIKEYQSGLSYGSHEMRDGVNISEHKRTKPVISANDIQSLRPNHAFLRLPGNLPITRIKISIP